MDFKNNMRKVPALKAVFARIFRLSADKEYLLHVQWKNQHRSISRPLSPGLIRGLTGVFAFLLLGIACLAWEAGYWALKEIRFHYASARHHIHVSELRDIQSGLKTIESSVEDAFEQEQRMRALYGINYLGSSQSAFGVGGRAYPTADEAELSQGLYENLFHAELKGRQLRGKLDYTLRNFLQIQEFVDYRHDLWDHTPSVSPAPGNWTSGFGYRVHPVSGKYKAHMGLDISGNRYTPVHATANGRVAVSGADDGGYGNLVVIQHGNGYSTKYGHLNKILVKRGQRVKRFDLIGYMGSTGIATGVHVHYEVVQGKQPLDPEKFILPTGLVVD
jgi:murein DD-endopeptidase MepM/ murein hydrolase activator NlpD